MEDEGEGGDTNTQKDKRRHMEDEGQRDLEGEGEGERGGTNTQKDKRGHLRDAQI